MFPENKNTLPQDTRSPEQKLKALNELWGVRAESDARDVIANADRDINDQAVDVVADAEAIVYDEDRKIQAEQRAQPPEQNLPPTQQ